MLLVGVCFTMYFYMVAKRYAYLGNKKEDERESDMEIGNYYGNSKSWEMWGEVSVIFWIIIIRPFWDQN